MQNIQNKAIAEQAALERMLNVYFRENQLYHNAPEHQQWHIRLNANETLIGTFLYWSMMGHHVYQKQVFIKKGDVISPVTCQHAIERLLSIFKDESNHARVQEIYADIQNSMSRTAHYLNDKDDTRTVDHYIQSEQSLYLGHPFHPTPKSSKGFTSEDLKRYAPEYHTHFQLHYLSVDASLILARDVEGLTDTVTKTLYQLAFMDKADLPQGHTLLPLHPYQMRHLQEDPVFKAQLDCGRIIDLGQRGRSVYPTSSVRTVFEKELNIYLKLPIHVKITNFIRTNNFEQIERTLDAATVIAHVKNMFETPTFKLMFEQGYRALHLETSSSDKDWITETALIVREGINEYDESKDIHVLASLFETMPNATHSMLYDRVQQSGLSVETWLQRYLDVVIQPMLTLFATTGISLEGHVQNTLIQFQEGIPKVCYVRDLEGVCLSETLAREAHLVPQIVDSNSPVVETHETAWHRFKYYVIVNHLGHLVSTLGKATGDEAQLWRVVRAQCQSWTTDKKIQRYVEDVLASVTFSAKANFMSKIKNCSENPIYINIPNPIRHVEEVSSFDAIN